MLNAYLTVILPCRLVSNFLYGSCNRNYSCCGHSQSYHCEPTVCFFCHPTSLSQLHQPACWQNYSTTNHSPATNHYHQH